VSNERLTESVFDATGDVTDNELDSLFQDLFRELDQPKTHGASGIDPARYNDKLDRLCRVYDDYCTLLRLPNGLSDQELFFYKALSVFSLARIDRFLTTPQKLVDILNRFSLTNNG
jgi:hypothetical protein